MSLLNILIGTFLFSLVSDTINLFCTKYWAVNNLAGITPNDPYLLVIQLLYQLGLWAWERVIFFLKSVN